ncbi:MAG: pre-peptidase C-terminal domain-containing protein, partial [Lachnospiraceae bacterium]|nr:pre-peptidase C-terminal domain-containing protein [Lachnospiraceae bacterium]
MSVRKKIHNILSVTVLFCIMTAGTVFAREEELIPDSFDEAATDSIVLTEESTGEADLTDAGLTDADLTDADITDADITDDEQTDADAAEEEQGESASFNDAYAEEGNVTDRDELADWEETRRIFEEYLKEYGEEPVNLPELDTLGAPDSSASEDTINGAGYDVGEPNDTKETATNVTLGRTYQGELGSYTKYRHDGLEDDYFKVQLQKGGSYRITLSGYHAEFVDTTCIVEMFTPRDNRVSLRSMFRDNKTDYCDYTAEATGTYYIHIYNYFDLQNKKSHYYSLKITHGAAPDEDFDIGEPNDTEDKAIPVTLGKKYRGELGSYTKFQRDRSDTDYFSVQMQKGATYYIGMSGYQGDLVNTTCIIEMYTPSDVKVTLSGDMKRNNVDYYKYQAGETGTYYIKIYNYFDPIEKRSHYYSLWVTQGSAAEPDEDFGVGEPNDTKAAATAVAMGKEYRGELGSYTKYTRSGVDNDYFSFKANKGSKYCITVSDYKAQFASTSCKVDVIAPSGKTTNISGSMKDLNVNSVTITADQTGTFYVRLYNYYDDTNRKEHYYKFMVTNGPVDPTTSISGAKITLKKSSYVYNGKARRPAVTSVTLGTKKLTENNDYTVYYSDNLNAGKAYAVIKGKGKYAGTAKKAFTIKKAKNTLKVSGKTVSVKASKVKKKSKTIKRKDFIKVTKKIGKATYKKTKGTGKITVSKSGKMT